MLFALLITSSYDHFQTRKKTNIALGSIDSELERNLAILIEWQERHIIIRDKVSSIAYGTNDSLTQLLSNFDFLNFGVLTDNSPLVSELLTFTAWETIKLTGIIGELDFETAQRLTMAYDMKKNITESTMKSFIDFYYSKEAHEMDNLTKIMLQFSLRLYELTIQEATAIIMVKQALKHLESLE